MIDSAMRQQSSPPSSEAKTIKTAGKLSTLPSKQDDIQQCPAGEPLGETNVGEIASSSKRTNGVTKAEQGVGKKSSEVGQVSDGITVDVSTLVSLLLQSAATGVDGKGDAGSCVLEAKNLTPAVVKVSKEMGSIGSCKRPLIWQFDIAIQYVLLLQYVLVRMFPLIARKLPQLSGKIRKEMIGVEKERKGPIVRVIHHIWYSQQDIASKQISQIMRSLWIMDVRKYIYWSVQILFKTNLLGSIKEHLMCTLFLSHASYLTQSRFQDRFRTTIRQIWLNGSRVLTTHLDLGHASIWAQIPCTIVYCMCQA